MIEVTLLNHLKKSLNVEVYIERPNRTPETFVVIERIGGNEENGLKSATFAIQSIAPSLYEAAKLNEQVKEAMTLLVGQTASLCKLNSDYNYTDTESEEFCYQAVFNINYY